MCAIAVQSVEPQSTRRSSGLARPVGILGTGFYAPRRVVTNEDLTRSLDTSDEWIITHTGIRERRYLEDGWATSDMCVQAATQALRNSDVRAEDVDAIVLATFTPDQQLPSTALMVKDALGAHRAIPLDLSQAACAGGIYGLLTGVHMLQNDRCSNVLVIGGDALSRVTDPEDRKTRVFFGDGAGAALLGATPPGFGLLSWHTASELSYQVEIPAGGSRRPATVDSVRARDHYLKMDGRAVWDIATEQLPRSIRNAVLQAGLSLDEVQHFLFHQANLNIITAAMESLDVPADRAPTSVSRLGNTGAASMFSVLHETMSTTARHGDHMVMAGIGAGFMWGALCFRHFGNGDGCSP